MQLIKSCDYKVMPWKNGQGTTAQIAIHPENLWRLSAATINQPGPFSEYKNCWRLLCLWKGDGLFLNNDKLNPNEVYRFDGEDSILCKNLSPEVIDLGLIFQKDKIHAEMNFMTFIKDQEIKFSNSLHFLFCIKGSFQVNSWTVNEGDTLKIFQDEVVTAKFDSLSRIVTCVHIEIRSL